MPACVHKRLVCVPNDCLRANGLPVYRMSVCVQIGCLSTDACLWANRLSVYRCLSVGKSVACLPMPVCVQIGCLPGVYLPMCNLRVCHMLVVTCEFMFSVLGNFFLQIYEYMCHLLTIRFLVSFDYLKNVKIDFKVPTGTKEIPEIRHSDPKLLVCITSKFHRTDNMGSST